MKEKKNDLHTFINFLNKVFYSPTQLITPLESRWQTANQIAAQRQTELETCADRLGSFASAANQLAPWLREKELMMSVLGPLSIDHNMLNTQKQQVQVSEGRRNRSDTAEVSVNAQTNETAKLNQNYQIPRTTLSSYALIKRQILELVQLS